MAGIGEYFQNMNWFGLLGLLLSVLSVLVCFTLHEFCHGYVAYRLGDPTAKNMGRLTFNPIKHIDVFGMLAMIFLGVGWAKAVPVDMRNFKKPKRDMAITSLAGPASNLLTALVMVALCSLLYRFTPWLESTVWLFCFSFLSNIAVLSVGMGLFNLLPISPLDGSKILFSVLPDRVYYTILRYERFILPVVLALMFFGVFSKPLSYCIYGVLNLLCAVAGVPSDAILIGSSILNVLR